MIKENSVPCKWCAFFYTSTYYHFINNKKNMGSHVTLHPQNCLWNVKLLNYIQKGRFLAFLADLPR